MLAADLLALQRARNKLRNKNVALLALYDATLLSVQAVVALRCDDVFEQTKAQLDRALTDRSLRIPNPQQVVDGKTTMDVVNEVSNAQKQLVAGGFGKEEPLKLLTEGSSTLQPRKTNKTVPSRQLEKSGEIKPRQRLTMPEKSRDSLRPSGRLPRRTSREKTLQEASEVTEDEDDSSSVSVGSVAGGLAGLVSIIGTGNWIWKTYRGQAKALGNLANCEDVMVQHATSLGLQDATDATTNRAYISSQISALKKDNEFILKYAKILGQNPDVSNMAATHTFISGAIAALQKDNETLKEENNKLTAKFEACIGKKKKTGKLEANVADVQVIHDLQRSKDEASKLNSEVQRLQSEIQHTKTLHEQSASGREIQLTNENTNLTTEVDRLQEQMRTAATAHTEEMKELKANYESREKELLAQKSEHDANIVAVKADWAAAILAQKLDFENRLATVQEDRVFAVTQQKSECEQRMLELERRHATQTGKIENFEARMSEATKAAIETNKAHCESEKAILSTSHAKEIQAQHNLLEEFKERISALQQTLHTQEAKYNETIRQLRAEQESQQQHNVQLLLEMKETNLANNNMAQAIQSLTTEKLHPSEILANLKANWQQLNERLSTCQTELGKAQSNHAEDVASLTVANSTLTTIYTLFPNWKTQEGNLLTDAVQATSDYLDDYNKTYQLVVEVGGQDDLYSMVRSWKEDAENVDGLRQEVRNCSDELQQCTYTKNLAVEQLTTVRELLQDEFPQAEQHVVEKVAVEKKKKKGWGSLFSRTAMQEEEKSASNPQEQKSTEEVDILQLTRQVIVNFHEQNDALTRDFSACQTRREYLEQYHNDVVSAAQAQNASDKEIVAHVDEAVRVWDIVRTLFDDDTVKDPSQMQTQLRGWIEALTQELKDNPNFAELNDAIIAARETINNLQSQLQEAQQATEEGKCAPQEELHAKWEQAINKLQQCRTEWDLMHENFALCTEDLGRADRLCASGKRPPPEAQRQEQNLINFHLKKFRNVLNQATGKKLKVVHEEFQNPALIGDPHANVQPNYDPSWGR